MENLVLLFRRCTLRGSVEKVPLWLNEMIGPMLFGNQCDRMPTLSQRYGFSIFRPYVECNQSLLPIVPMIR